MFAHRTPLAPYRLRKRCGREHRAIQLFCEVLHADEFVDRRAHHCELQALMHTHIAVDHVPQIESNAEFWRCVGFWRRPQSLPRLQRRCERAFAGFFGAILYAEQAKHGIANQ